MDIDVVIKFVNKFDINFDITFDINLTLVCPLDFDKLTKLDQF